MNACIALPQKAQIINDFSAQTKVAEGYMKRSDKDAAELAWKMFEKTGSVSYYMLYKQLSGRE